MRSSERQQDLLLMTAAVVSALDPESAESFCRRLWNRNELISKVVKLAAAFQKESGSAELSVPETRRLSLHLDGVALLCALLEGAGVKGKAASIAGTAKKCNVWSSAPKPLLTGKHGIEAGIAPGQTLGAMLKICFEAQLEGVFETVEEGKVFLKNLQKGPDFEK
jgi:tRNA nucleotidyltransferase (CCA-adding enzyme)